MDSWIGILGVCFLQISTSFALQFCPILLWTVFTDRVPLLFWSRTEEWPLSCSKSLCIERNELSTWLEFLLLSLDPHEMSLNIDMKMIRPLNFSGATLNLDSNSWTMWLSSKCGESWEDVPLEFHWLTINSVQSSVFWWTFEPLQSVFPNSIWFWVLVHLSKT